MCRDDAPFTQPEDSRSEHHRDAHWYVKTWLGLALGMAVNAAAAVHPTRHWPFSFDRSRVLEIVQQAQERVANEMLDFSFGLDESKFLQPQGKGELVQFLYHAMVRLTVNPCIVVHLTLPRRRRIQRRRAVAVVHDLRYIADNKFAHVSVHADTHDASEWSGFIDAAKGSTVWEWIQRVDALANCKVPHRQ